MQVNNNSPSFGMAFRVSEGSLTKALPEEVQKVRDIVKQAGKQNLDKASEYSSSLLSANVKDGKVQKFYIYSIPTEISGLLGFFKDAFALKMGIIKDVSMLKYLKPIDIADFNSDNLLKAVENTSKAGIARFGSNEMVKSILNNK